MNIMQRKRLVSRELVELAARQPEEFAALSERHYQGRIEAIAGEILASGRRIVMLTGASAAGKTTSAHKLAEVIGANGRHSVVLSLDDFFVGEGRYPKNRDGSDDYESLHALDLPVLRRCLEELYRDGVCQAPVFDFRLQRPNGSQQIDCRDGVVIIEGLHALNPALTENLPADAVFCLYAGLREEYAGPDGSRFLATRDIRLARRVVRDYLFRGHGPSFTLGLWGHVCAGEDRFIKPYKPRADLLLDTTHTYEVCLWRNVLDSMPPDPDLTETQRRQLEALCGKFAVFPALDPALVPQNSMLREFIGTQNA
ncbi:MAG TPA: nucleoside kinase [Candidatus Gemmiger avistercoris]|uniref:Nucleoside kinase n=1 Tax=Candidatus Gemmiger avistercoris TaxID=2838606 RepID=A0A9D2JMR5_9FIRM|nr:nucleoside kinase [uncultured Subdoligranulum sp.]HIZ61205.1 nucleoside kinase [Candidatus Gemmiger avistercoris]